MRITSVNSNANSISRIVSDKVGTNEANISAVNDAGKQNAVTTADKNQPNESDLKNITEELNDFMQSINTDIKFELHTETNTLMIQVEDSKTQKILKEVPAHELLDMMTKIKDCIGAFFDKKA